MIFPLSLKRHIVFSQDEFPISSEKYITNHIEEYMTQFGMMKNRRADNELFYLNMDPIKSMARRSLMRNLLIRVEVIDNKVKITLETAVILHFVISLLSFVVPLFLPPSDGKIFIPILVVSLIGLNYGIIFIVLNTYKKEIRELVWSLK
ncbi:MAG: hypothetical protein HWE22_04610 [Flavobacteriales bacterium]|nr:hypothetical protein [Flavobacteriales bacterium]